MPDNNAPSDGAKSLANGGAMSSTDQPHLALPSDAAKIAEMGRRVAAAFGEIVAVLMRSPQHRHAFLSDLEWLVLPAIATGQFALAEARQKDSGFGTPVAVLFWASVSDDVDARLSANVGQLMKLKPTEWAGGQNAWLIEAVGDPRAVKALIDQTLAGPLKGRGINVVIRGADGKPAIQILRAGDTATAAAPSA